MLLFCLSDAHKQFWDSWWSLRICTQKWIFEQCFFRLIWMICCSTVSEQIFWVHWLCWICCCRSSLFSFFNAYHLLSTDSGAARTMWMSIEMWFYIIAHQFTDLHSCTALSIASDTNVRSMTLCWTSLFQVNSSHKMNSLRPVLWLQCEDDQLVICVWLVNLLRVSDEH
jgi:hypothetical protein